MVSYDKMAEVIDYMVAHPTGMESLETLAARFSTEPTSFQKSFQNYVGVSPKQLQRYMAMSQVREFLLEGYPTLEAAYQAGLSGNARLHDLCVTIDAATPGEIKSRGQGVIIYYGWHDTPFGKILLGVTDKGVCWLSFEFEGKKNVSLDTLKNRLRNAEFIEDKQKTLRHAELIKALWNGDVSQKIRLNLFGTNFQLQVWQALLKIPRGGSVSYGTIAEDVCTKKASRAVGTAVGANPVSYIIPCHRVIQQSGIVENYAWGSARKKVLLGLEARSEDSV